MYNDCGSSSAIGSRIEWDSPAFNSLLPSLVSVKYAVAGSPPLRD
jgi:hypothetical protein